MSALLSRCPSVDDLLTMVLCFALTISVAVSIGLASRARRMQANNANMLDLVKEMFGSINKFPLAAIPFFILAGNLMETGGISQPAGRVRQERSSAACRAACR